MKIYQNYVRVDTDATQSYKITERERERVCVCVCVCVCVADDWIWGTGEMILKGEYQST
jgi:hypothetical protein